MDNLKLVCDLCRLKMKYGYTVLLDNEKLFICDDCKTKIISNDELEAGYNQ